MNGDDYNIDELRELFAIGNSITSTGPSNWSSYNVTSNNIVAADITGSTVVPWKEHHIRGEMLLATQCVDDSDVENFGKEKIREELAKQIAVELLRSKHIEFTQMRDHFSGRLIVKARVYVVPDGQVKILRTSGV